jgi:hypothetical protein
LRALERIVFRRSGQLGVNHRKGCLAPFSRLQAEIHAPKDGLEARIVDIEWRGRRVPQMHESSRPGG